MPREKLRNRTRSRNEHVEERESELTKFLPKNQPHTEAYPVAWRRVFSPWKFPFIRPLEQAHNFGSRRKSPRRYTKSFSGRRVGGVRCCRPSVHSIARNNFHFGWLFASCLRLNGTALLRTITTEVFLPAIRYCLAPVQPRKGTAVVNSPFTDRIRLDLAFVFSRQRLAREETIQAKIRWSRARRGPSNRATRKTTDSPRFTNHNKLTILKLPHWF